MNDEYKRYYPNHHMYIERIMEEIQLFGGNSFANLFRRNQGVLYREILCDVCDKMKVNYSSNVDVKQIEQDLLIKILNDHLKTLNARELEEFLKELDLVDKTKTAISYTPQTASAIVQAAIKAGGFKSYIIILKTVNMIWKFLFGKGLPILANATIARIIGIYTGPVGWAITGAWTAVDLASPAYRVTIPMCLLMAKLRIESQQNN
ncbi:YaaW family protein [uncultured Campylobacter sp.]|nr:ubiquinol-cytochrome C chaperone family protein [uncultured Campylobacter sp.]